jgi:patatin-related protein
MPKVIKDPPLQEIRFAVVLYGGVSLAIYINGVAQELLRMVRSTAFAKSDLSGTELIYRRIGLHLVPGRVPGEAKQMPEDDSLRKARFVVDIISGTSAGGINGVALAKSLALQCPDMKALENTWLKKAQIDQLLNQRGGPKTSLLDSAYMYEIVLDTLKEIGQGADPDPAANPGLADQLDLFVTASSPMAPAFWNGFTRPCSSFPMCRPPYRRHRAPPPSMTSRWRTIRCWPSPRVAHRPFRWPSSR